MFQNIEAACRQLHPSSATALLPPWANLDVADCHRPLSGDEHDDCLEPPQILKPRLSVPVELFIQSLPDRTVVPLNAAAVWFHCPPRVRLTLILFGKDADPPVVSGLPVVGPPARRGLAPFPARHCLPVPQRVRPNFQPCEYGGPLFTLEPMAAGGGTFFSLAKGYVPWGIVRVIHLEEGPLVAVNSEPAAPRGAA